MKKKEFLSAVEHEVKMLKELATKKEINNLNFELLNPLYPKSCIYGQMTGCCASRRAKKLMDKACIIVTNTADDFGDGGVDTFRNKTFNDSKKFINGQNTGQGWINGRRKYTHISVLEAYICMKNAKNENIIEFLKGNKNKLVL